MLSGIAYFGYPRLWNLLGCSAALNRALFLERGRRLAVSAVGLPAMDVDVVAVAAAAVVASLV